MLAQGYVDDQIGIVLTLGMLAISPALWETADSFVAETLGVGGDSGWRQYAHAMTFVMIGVILEWPISFIIKAYRTFVIEEELYAMPPRPRSPPSNDFK